MVACRTAKIAEGSASMVRWTSIRSSLIPASCQEDGSGRPALDLDALGAELAELVAEAVGIRGVAQVDDHLGDALVRPAIGRGCLHPGFGHGGPGGDPVEE